MDSVGATVVDKKDFFEIFHEISRTISKGKHVVLLPSAWAKLHGTPKLNKSWKEKIVHTRQPNGDWMAIEEMPSSCAILVGQHWHDQILDGENTQRRSTVLSLSDADQDYEVDAIELESLIDSRPNRYYFVLGFRSKKATDGWTHVAFEQDWDMISFLSRGHSNWKDVVIIESTATT